VTAYDWLMKAGTVPAAVGKKCVCTQINGNWYVTGLECP
jgi:hypothetical protein